MKIAVLVSGHGSNLQAIIDAIEARKLLAQIVLVICNHPQVSAVERSQKHKIPYLILKHQDSPSREEYDRRLIEALETVKAQLIVLAGFDRLLSPLIVRHYRWRIINIHPALLPAFPGLHAIDRAYEAGVSETGVTVHFVDEGTDTGPVILQSPVKIEKEDTKETLEKKIHHLEHQLYPQAIQLFAEKSLQVREGKVMIRR